MFDGQIMNKYMQFYTGTAECMIQIHNNYNDKKYIENITVTSIGCDEHSDSQCNDYAIIINVLYVYEISTANWSI